jgi:hypothetical protein
MADTKKTMDFFMSPDDYVGIQFEDFIIAVATWGWMRPGNQPTVREAAEQFGVVDQVIVNAVKRHPWMFLSGEDCADPTTIKIEFDGE